LRLLNTTIIHSLSSFDFWILLILLRHLWPMQFN
jgi:hypothetical protein